MIETGKKGILLYFKRGIGQNGQPTKTAYIQMVGDTLELWNTDMPEFESGTQLTFSIHWKHTEKGQYRPFVFDIKAAKQTAAA